MATINEIKTKIKKVNALGRQNLTEKGVAVPESATTFEIMKGIADVEVGGGDETAENILEHATQLNNLYNAATFPEGTVLMIDVPYVTNMSSVFSSASGVEKVILKGNKNDNEVNFYFAFYNCKSITEIDASGFNVNVGRSDYVFTGCTNLVRIIGELYGKLNHNYIFRECYALEEIRLKTESQTESIHFPNCNKLSTESIQSIINGLATVGSAQTLTLNSAIVLTDEQKATINEKGWTLVQ